MENELRTKMFNRRWEDQDDLIRQQISTGAAWNCDVLIQDAAATLRLQPLRRKLRLGSSETALLFPSMYVY